MSRENQRPAVCVELAHALARALLNDARGIVSEPDATRLVEVGLAEIAAADDPNRVLARAKRIIAAAELLVGSDRDATRVLEQFDGRARTVAASRLAELKAGPLGSSAVAERVLAALRSSFGTDAGVTVNEIETIDGRTFARIDNISEIGSLAARVELGEDPEGEPEIAAVEIIIAPTLIDPELRRSLEHDLTEHFGLANPIVEGIASTDHPDATEFHLLVDSDAGRRAVSMWVPRDGLPSLGSYQFDEQRLRQQALPRMVGEALEIAKQIGPAAELEVYLRGSARTPAQLERITEPEQSAVGIGADEVQLFAANLLGDIGVYLTINRETGEYRIEEFN